MEFIKKGKIFAAYKVNDWWVSHTMAPTAILLNDKTIRIYLGAWDSLGISRIGFVDVDKSNPLKIQTISNYPVLDIGADGCFDENGIFPAHASVIEGKIYLYYTGFQLGHKIRHYNFGGLALGSEDDTDYKRVSESPVLDRKDEGLLVRAGQSVIFEDGIFKTVYSAGSKWREAGGKPRPCYDIYYQESKDGISYADKGTRILSADHSIEHGLGRPQIMKLEEAYYVFYTRRLLSMKYFFGVAKSEDGKIWRKIDNEVRGISHSENGWDSDMIYFPSVLQVDNKIYMFYCGNDFGKTGFGFAEIKL